MVLIVHLLMLTIKSVLIFFITHNIFMKLIRMKWRNSRCRAFNMVCFLLVPWLIFHQLRYVAKLIFYKFYSILLMSTSSYKAQLFLLLKISYLRINILLLHRSCYKIKISILLVLLNLIDLGNTICILLI
jgi:hypothetical protein